MKELRSSIVIYNTIKKEPIGIFSTKAMLCRYLFKENKIYHQSMLTYRLKNKTAIKKGIIFNFPIAVRYANIEQETLLNKEHFLILNNYPKKCEASILGFKDDRHTFNHYSNEKLNSYKIEQYRIKEANKIVNINYGNNTI